MAKMKIIAEITLEKIIDTDDFFDEMATDLRQIEGWDKADYDTRAKMRADFELSRVQAIGWAGMRQRWKLTEITNVDVEEKKC